MRNTDLHTHSFYSDGQIYPKELVRLAKKRGIKNLALTDHDSINGVKEAILEGQKIGVNVIPAIEVRADNGEVLSYFIDIDNKELKSKLRQSRQRVADGVKDWCKKLNKAGYEISFKEIQRKFPKSKNNINEFYPLYLLYLKGYGPMLKLAKKFKEEGIKKKKIKEITIPQAIELVKKAHGIPVLAHPWVENGFFLKEKNFRKCIKAGLQGIELNNGDRAPFKKKGSDKKIRKLAKKYSLVLTSGSDYHGLKITKQMPGNHELGENNCDDSVIEQLKQKYKELYGKWPK